MGIERRNGYWLWIGGPVPPGSAGITLRRLIIMRKRSAAASPQARAARLPRHIGVFCWSRWF